MPPSSQSRDAGAPRSLVALTLAWLAVGLPLAWGVLMTLQKAALLFK
jgi:hypothetical protein